MWALSHLTPRETESMLFILKGMNPSRSSLDRLSKAINEEVISKESKSCAVSLEGVMIGMKPDVTLLKESITRTQWREASCRTISFLMPLVSVFQQYNTVVCQSIKNSHKKRYCGFT